MSLGLQLYRYRSYTPLPLFALALMFGSPSLQSVGLGLSICLIGELIRFRGVRTAGALTRMQAAPGGDVLVTNGPYAYIRNPIYAANILIYSGVGVMSGSIWISLMSISWFVLQYVLIIAEEERYLLEHFGERYFRYCAAVPRLIPRLTAYHDVSPDATPVWCTARDIWRTERSTLVAIGSATAIMLLSSIFIA